MFKRIYTYHLKEISRVREIMFWNLIFPILLSTIMFISFSNLDEAYMIETINVASNSNMFKQILSNFDEGEENSLYKLVDVSEPKSAVESGEIDGYVSGEAEDLKLLIKEDNLKSSVLINTLNISKHKTELINKAAADGLMNPQSANYVINEVTRFDNHIKSGFGGDGKKGMNTFYYAMMAMVCMGSMSAGAATVAKMSNIPENTFAKRMLISPISKIIQILPRLLSALTLSFIQSSIVLAYMILVLRIDFGTKIIMLIPGVLVGSLFGILLGVLLALLLNKGESMVLGATTAFYLFSTFIAGLMVQSVPLIIEENLPLLNRINPATIIYKYFYTLYYYDDMENVMKRLGIMILATMITLIMVVFMARRRDRVNG